MSHPLSVVAELLAAVSSGALAVLGVRVGVAVRVGVRVRVGVAVRVAVRVGVVVRVGVAVRVGVGAQVVWLSRKLYFSCDWPLGRAATLIVLLALKLLTTTLNTSEAPLLNVLNFGSKRMLVKPGLPLELVQTVL